MNVGFGRPLVRKTPVGWADSAVPCGFSDIDINAAELFVGDRQESNLSGRRNSATHSSRVNLGVLDRRAVPNVYRVLRYREAVVEEVLAKLRIGLARLWRGGGQIKHRDYPHCAPAPWNGFHAPPAVTSTDLSSIKQVGFHREPFWKCQGAVATGERSAHGGRTGMEGEQQRFPTTADTNGFVEQRKKSASGSAFGEVGYRLTIDPDYLTYPPVNVMAVRFQQVIRQTERIAAVSMVHTERGNQSGRDHAARHSGPNDSVAVVQKHIHTLDLATAAESLAEQARPVSLRGLGFKIIWIARANPASHQSEPPVPHTSNW